MKELDKQLHLELILIDEAGFLIDEAGVEAYKPIERLIAQGADVNAADNQGWTSAHRAAVCGRVQALALLIHHGADLTAKTTKGLSCYPAGSTPRGIALEKGETRVVAMIDEALATHTMQENASTSRQPRRSL